MSGWKFTFAVFMIAAPLSLIGAAIFGGFYESVCKKEWAIKNSYQMSLFLLASILSISWGIRLLL